MQIAHAKGYYLKTINFPSRMMYFIDPVINIRIMVYFTKRGYTVATCLNHPAQGATQLIRAACDTDELTSIFANPRLHTGKGYQRREQKKFIKSKNNTKTAFSSKPI